jgi:hypothetical protein
MPPQGNTPFQAKCPNPACLASLTFTYAEVLRGRASICGTCGSRIEFDPDSVGKFRAALGEFRNLKDRLQQAQRAVADTLHTVS